MLQLCTYMDHTYMDHTYMDHAPIADISFIKYESLSFSSKAIKK